jgi:hypothetical protein
MVILLAVFLLFVSQPSTAQTPAADEPRITFTGYIQPQYELHTLDGDTTDRAIFRRMVLALEAELPSAWSAEFQADLGPIASDAGERLIVKDAYLRYDGWAQRGILVTIGNQKMPFSRTLLGPASRRGLVERPIGADRSLGSPGRALGVLGDGWHRGRTLHWSAVLASSRQSPDADEVRVDGIAEAETDWNEGPLLAARFEVHPLGEVPRAQTDFARGPFKIMGAVAAYAWWNDDDVPRHGEGLVDANRVAAFEVSGGVRGHGLSADAEFEHVVADAIDPGVNVGLYVDGRAAIRKGSVEAGYMLHAPHLEVLAGVDAAESDAFDATWRRLNTGMNWYVREHRLKFSLLHRESFNERGVRAARSRRTYLQAQFSF